MSTFFTISGWCFGLVSLLLSVYIYRRTRTVKNIRCRFRKVGSVHFGMGENRPEISLGGVPMGTHLSQIEIEIVNKGNASIPAGDAREPLHLRLSPSDSQLICVMRMKKKGSKNNTTKITQNENGADITWDYLDPGDEIRFRLYANGPVEDVLFDGNFSSGVHIRKRGEWSVDPRGDAVATAAIIWFVFGGSLFGVLFGALDVFRERTAAFGVQPDSPFGVIVAALAAGLTSSLVLGAIIAAIATANKTQDAIQSSGDE